MKKYTLGTWLDDWFEVYKKPTLKPSSLASIEICIRLHIPDSLKKLPLSGVEPLDIQRELNAIPSSRMRLYTYTVYTSAFSKAVALDIIRYNPMLAVDHVKHKRKRGTPFTIDEQTAFLASVEHHFLRRLFKFYLYTGCRRGEALSVTWHDVDFDKNTIHISGEKTYSSNRTIPLMHELREVLEKIPHNSDTYIFPYHADFVTKAFHKICPAHHLHDLRHTFATRCLECGISMKVVSSWLGHADISMTANTYTHIVDDFSFNQASLFTLNPNFHH